MDHATLAITKMTQSSKSSTLSRLRYRSNIVKQPHIITPLCSSLVLGAVAAIAFVCEQQQQQQQQQQDDPDSNDKQNIPIEQQRRRYELMNVSTMASTTLSKPMMLPQLLSNAFKTTGCSITQCDQQLQGCHTSISTNNDDDDDDDDLYHLIDTDIEDDEEESRNFLQTLRYHKSIAHVYKNKWDWKANDAKSSHIPTSSWPLNVPDEKEVGSLLFDLQFCSPVTNPSRRQPTTNNNTTNDDKNTNDTEYCQNLQFRIASHLLTQTSDTLQTAGLTQTKHLAEHHSHPDAICAYATCLNDGRAGLLEPNPTIATSWWKLASDQYYHVQSTYELGVAYYTGEGVVEDEGMAVRYFGKAAECGHVGAAYM